MRFLVDAQLPRRVAQRLRTAGYDSLHTLDLPDGNRTPDEEILRIAEEEGRAVATKDADFVSSFVIHRRPPMLLLGSTGNIGNAELETLISAALPQIVNAFTSAGFVELGRGSSHHPPIARSPFRRSQRTLR